MKKGLWFLSMVLCTVLLAACSSGSASTAKEEEPKDSTESLLVEKSDELFANLENHDWEAISKEVHPDGLVVTLFAYLGGSDEAALSAEELVAAPEEEIVWGMDLAGREIVATKDGFVDRYLFQTVFGEKVNYEKVNYNETSAPGGGVINNISTDYPDAKYVEYFSPASEREYDWQALRFVYQKHEGEWLLYAIVRDVYNP